MTGYILFHQFKHHLHYIKAWVENTAGSLSPENIVTIKTLGSSQLDMYCGTLSIEEILLEISAYLQAEGINNTSSYKQWVGDDFKLCTLSDGSVFTLRFIESEKPVHIHPARHVPYTMRIKANALKSIVCYRVAHGNTGNIDLEQLNNLRYQYLQLPPLSAKAGIEEIEKVFGLLAG